MKKIICILSIFCCLTTFGKDSLFTIANNEYSKKNYLAAINLYDSILSSGYASSEIFYNLGNCYYKKQDWANAIWHYEKALKLDSKNKKAKDNLEITQLKIVDQIESFPKLFYQIWWNKIITSFNTKTWQILAIICIWIVLIVQIVTRLRSKKTTNLVRFLSLLSIVLFCIALFSFKEKQSVNEAIIFSSSVVVNSAPSNNSTNLFTLHLGSKVEIIDQIGNWINIKLVNGNSGWIKESECKILD